MFERNEPVMTVPATRIDGLVPVKGNVTVAAWSLSDLAFYAIRESNDFRTKNTTVHDLVALCNELTAWDETVASVELKDLSEQDTFLRFAVGFPQKQFWYQERTRLTHEFNRQVELLERIPAQIGSKLDLDGACRSETGFALRPFRMLLLALAAYGVKNTDVTYPMADGTAANFDGVLTAANMKRVIDFYTADYSEFRTSSLEENHFFLKPLVRTSHGRVLNVNQFLLARKAVDGPLWVVRDYFNKRSSADFVNEYGLYFEQYVSNLLRTYLRPDQFQKVSLAKNIKTADWFVHIGRYRLIVEQKTALAALMLKRPYPSITQVDAYLSKLTEGVAQLDTTEFSYPSDKASLKLLLHYETLYFSDGILRTTVLSRTASALHTSERIFFLDIDEFERLIALIGLDEAVAESILEEKLRREPEPLSTGREFSQVISSLTGMQNVYVQHAIDHWHDYFLKSYV
jgi:hypothetical protein